MKAGTLEIELITNVARLQKEMREIRRAVGDSMGKVSNDTRAANDNLARFGKGVAGAGGGARLAGHHVQNLTFQLQDMVVGLASGQKPLTVFLQQGTQVAGIMQQAGVGVGGLTKQVGGMAVGFARAHPVLLAVATAAAAAGGAFKLFQSEVKKSGELTKYAQGLGLTHKEMKKLEDVGITAGDVFRGLYRTFDEYLGLSAIFASLKAFAIDAFEGALNVGKMAAAGIYAGWVGSFRAIGIIWKSLPEVIGEGVFAAANLTLKAVEAMINKAIDLLDGPLATVNALLKQAGFSGIGQLQKVSFGSFGDPFAGSAASTAGAVRDAFSGAFAEASAGMDSFGSRFRKNTIQASKDRLRGQADAIIADRSEKASKARKEGLSEEEKALKRAIEESTRYAEALEQEAARVGKTAIEIKKMEIAANAAAAPTSALRQRIIDAGVAWENAYRAQANKDFESNVLQPIRDELALLGLVGPARDLAALALEEEAFKAELLAKGVTNVNEKWAEYLRLRTQLINGESALEKEREQAELLAREIDRIIGALGGLGGVGRTIGSLLGFTTGNIGAIGGPVGDLLNLQVGQQEKDGKLIARTLGDELRDVFKLSGEFGKTMSSLLQGAGTGLIAGQAFFGKQSGTEQLGSALGGTLGKMAGEALGKAIGGTLGKALGPLGSIAGSLLGGLLGGLLKKTPKGTATIGAVDGALGITGTGGNSRSRIAAATKSANAIIDGLESLADEFGATIDPTRGSVSIGIRKKSFRVDPSGRGMTKTKNGAIDFGQDGEAAAYYAMLDLIKDGALLGLRAGTEALLKNAKDLEKGIAKALKFEGVFKELAQLRDPLAFALGELTEEFDRLRKIFAEAGATAQEYADLEELLARKRQDIIDEQASRQIEELSDRNGLEVELLRLLGREEDALAAARLHELAGLKASLRPLQAMVYQLQDARTIIEKFGPLADDLRDFRKELLGGGAANNSLAFLAQQFRETAALAKDGDATALGNLRGTASEFLDAAKVNAASALDYQRAVGEVLASVDQGIFAADAQIEYAQLQIDAINHSANILQSMKDEMATYQARLVEQGEWVERLFRRWDGDGLLIRTDSDTPIQVETV